jgi:NAD(P)-dependent dehydrogenase (short-subunit alcohol dehydrogenase family)
VSPGLINREGLQQDWPEGVDRWRRSASLRRLGEPEDVANAVAFLVSPAAEWITGHDLVIDGGASIAPAFGGQ